MNLHVHDLTSRLGEYLARRVPPKSFGGDENLKSEQMNEYIRILRRFAPEGDALAAWWRTFADRLSDETDTWAWPSPKDVARAARAAGATAKPAGGGWRPDSVQINLDRLNAGQPIGEDWLWGRNALRLEAAGASRHVLRQRRVQLAEGMAETHPPDQVRAKLLDLKARHEAARREDEDSQVIRRDAVIPDKAAFSKSELEALVE